MTKQRGPFIALQGSDWYIVFTRLDGYTLYIGGEIKGSFDTLPDAEEYRNELAYETLRRTA